MKPLIDRAKEYRRDYGQYASGYAIVGELIEEIERLTSERDRLASEKAAIEDMLRTEWQHNNPDTPCPNFTTMAIALKQAAEAAKEEGGGE